MFNWKIKQKITASNAIYLEDSNGQEGRPFKARFLQAGLVKYDFGVCLLKKETIDKFVHTFLGKHVIIGHKDTISEQDKKNSIENIWFNPEDGWFWCSGTLTNEQAIELVEKGYNVSCQYAITDFSVNTEGKLHNGNPYDKEILNGVFEHLAIVENPRYEDAFIAVNAYIAEGKDKYKPIFDYIQTTKGEPMDKETKGVFEQLINALKARNEAEKDETKKEEKAENEDVDKRDIIRKIMAIAGKHEDNEDVRTIAKLAEKLAYDKSEAGTADNKAKNEDDEDEEKSEDNTEDAKNKCKNKAKNEDDIDYKALYEELKSKTEKEAENKKAKNSMDALKNLFYEGASLKDKKRYMSQKEGIELGKQLY